MKYENLFEEEISRIENILNQKKVKIQDYKIENTTYRFALVDFSTMQVLKQMEKNFGEYIKEKFNTTLKRPYYYVAKLICGQEPIDYFRITMQKKYIYVKDKEKILRDLEKLFTIWKNKKILETKKYIKRNRVTEIEAKKLQDKTLQEIEEAQQELLNIQKHPEKYELIRTNYHYAKYYPEIIYRLQSESRYRTTLLRKNVLNIICYEPLKREKKRRRDMEIEKFLEDAYNPFEYIFAKRVEKGTDSLIS